MCLIKNESYINRTQFKEHQQESSEILTPLNYIHNDSYLNTTNERYRPRVVKILEDYISIIATSSDDLSQSKLTLHEINLIPGTQPIKQRSYRISKFKADILKKELIKLINKKLIVPSHSAWSSLVVIVPKSNGKWRICIDNRKFNDVTIKDAYSLPFIDEIFDGRNGATVFSTLDLYSGYHQIPMHPDSVDITSFTTLFRNFCFKVMPFGLCNAPATFQREMNQILFPLIGKCVYNFIDDILIYSKS